jgi:hypothetical protein
VELAPKSASGKSGCEVNYRYFERQRSKSVGERNVFRMISISSESRLVLEHNDKPGIVRSSGRLAKVPAAVQANNLGDPLRERCQIGEQRVQLALPLGLHGEEHNMVEHGISLLGLAWGEACVERTVATQREVRGGMCHARSSIRG